MPDNQGDYYEAALTIKAKLGIAKEILKKLKSSSDARLKIFRTTCFGPWLDISTAYGDPLLIHLMLQTQIHPDPESTDMWFRVGDYELRFGQKEFCLITGFRFGQVPLLETSTSSFRARMFSRISLYQSVKVSDLLQVFRSREFAELADVDAVRICLLVLLEVGFMGHEDKSVVADRLLYVVDDLVSWNRYPWGSYIWPTTYNQLNRALSKRGHHVGVRTTAKRVAKYTLTGFVYAFKIWIFETFPIAREFAMREKNAIPRAIAWRRTHALSWDTCQQFLDVDTDGRRPQTELTPTKDEQSAEWWMDSCRFLDGVVDNLSPVPKKSRQEPPPQRNEVGTDNIDEVAEQKPPLLFRDGRPQTHPDPANESSYTAVPTMSHPVPPSRPVSDAVPNLTDFGTALSRPFFMSFYYGGNIEYENGEIKRDESTSTFTIPARHKMRYQEFVDLVYAAVGVEKENFKLKFTLYFELCGKPNSSLITSDGTLDLIFFLAEKDEGFRAHIHFEMVEILQGK